MGGLTRVAGWVAVGISTLFSCLWAFWGANEAFHEGWFARTWYGNVAGAVAYLAPMLCVMVPALVAVVWRRVGVGLHVLVAAVAIWRFELYDNPGVLAILGLPLGVLAALYYFGRPEPRRRALWIVGLVPLVTAVVCGAYPAWLAVTRVDDGNYGVRVIEGNGVRLAWAPQGPGWPESPANWEEARSACAHLSRDGSRLEEDAVRVWRLPTVDEAVRSAVRGGKNAGGTWEAGAKRASYRVAPNKETPLWTRYSQAMYRWTGTEIDERRAYRYVWNGYANSLTKTVRIHFRCVAEPDRVR